MRQFALGCGEVKGSEKPIADWLLESRGLGWRGERDACVYFRDW